MVTMQLHRTKIGLDISRRERLADSLQPVLATLVDLSLMSKHAHWNVKGPNFQALHELFDSVTAIMQESADLVAERIAQLGGTAMGRSQDLCATKLEEYPSDAVNGQQHLEALTTALADAGKLASGLIRDTTDLGDDGTADILTEVTRNLDKQLWFLEAHLQG